MFALKLNQFSIISTHFNKVTDDYITSLKYRGVGPHSIAFSNPVSSEHIYMIRL